MEVNADDVARARLLADALIESGALAHDGADSPSARPPGIMRRPTLRLVADHERAPAPAEPAEPAEPPETATTTTAATTAATAPPPDADALLRSLFTEADRLYLARARELRPWRYRQMVAFKAEVAIALLAALVKARDVRLPYLPRFGEAGDPRAPIDLVVSSVRIDNRARAELAAESGRRFGWWRHHVRIGRGLVKRQAIRYVEHAPDGRTGRWYLRSVSVVYGYRQPPRWRLGLAALAIVAGYPAAVYGCSVAAMWLLDHAAVFAARYAGATLTVLLALGMAYALIRPHRHK